MAAASSEEDLAEFVDQLLTAPSWAQTVSLVKENPELLAPAVAMIDGLRDRVTDPALNQTLADHRRLLELAMQSDVTQALAEFAPFKTDAGRPADVEWITSLVADFAMKRRWYERRAFLEKHPFLLNGLAADLADLLAQDQTDPAVAGLVRQTAAFLRQCREVGVKEAVLEGAVLSMIYARDPDEALQVAADYPPALSNHADAVARRHIAAIADPQQRTSAEAWWTQLREAVQAVGDPGLLRQLDFADLLDELAQISDLGDLVQFLTDHPELMTGPSQDGAEHRRNDSATFKEWWNWNRYLTLLQRAAVSTPEDAVAAFQAADRYEIGVASAAVLHANTDLGVYLLYSAFPSLAHGLVLQQLTELVTQAGSPVLASRVETLRAFAHPGPHPGREPLAADAWDGRRLTREHSVALHRSVMNFFGEERRPDPDVPELCLGLLEVLLRLGTLEPPEIVEVTSAAARLHLEQGREPQAAERAVQLLEESAAHADREHQAVTLINLANGYAERSGRTGVVADLDAAVSAARRAVDTATDDAWRQSALGLLARLLSSYPEHAYDPARTQEALDVLSRLSDSDQQRLEVLCRALSVYPSASLMAEAADAAGALGTADGWDELATAAAEAYVRHEHHRFWDEAWAAALAAERAAADADSRQNARSKRAELIAKRADRDVDAVGQLADALALTDLPTEKLGADADALRRAARATVLITRHTRGEMRDEDLREGVELLRALNNEPAARELAIPAELAVGLSLLSEASGDQGMLDEAIELFQRELRRRPGDSAARAALGSAWRRRFLEGGRVSDLSRAITVMEEGASTPGAMTSAQASLINNLASAYSTRWEMFADVADIDRSISLLEELITALPANPRFLTNLGTDLTRRARARPDRRDHDLRRAIDVAARADQLTPQSSSFKARRVLNRAVAHLTAAFLLDDVEHADAAVRFAEHAIALAGPDSPFIGQYQSNIVSALRLKAQLTNDRRYMEEACRIGDEAVERLRTHQLSWLPEASDLVGSCHADLGQWEEAARVFAAGAEVADLLVGAQPGRPHRMGWLRRAGSLPMYAAYAQAKTGDLEGAATSAERGRATELTRALDLFSVDTAELSRGGFSLLARRWQDLAARVARDDTGAHEDAEELLLRLRQVRAEVDRALGGDRAEPGLAIPGVALVYLIATCWGGLAVLVFADRPWQSVWLPELTDDRAEQLGRRLMSATPDDLEGFLPSLLAWLQPQVAQVISAVRGLPLVLVPTGLLGVLPIQAATAPTASTQAPAAAVVTIRHAPNLRALRGRAATQRRPVTEVTAIASGFEDLTYAAAEAQLAATALGAGTVLHADRDITPDAVLAALGQHGVVHFACHAVAVPASPLDSSLRLRPGTQLTLRDILRCEVAADLVILSACETAVPGDELPDEMIGLPAALLQAGAGGVIGTLWQVADDACLWFTLCLYAGLRSGSDPWTALCDAQELLRTATTGKLQEYLNQLAPPNSSWPPPGVIAACRKTLEEMDASDAAFTEPADWAGFVYIG
jgi:CHAT domain-containing protein